MPLPSSLRALADASTAPPGSSSLRSRAQRAALWAVLAALVWFTGKAAEEIGLPAPHLLSAVLWGVAAALSGVVGTGMPPRVHLAAQAMVGVVIGTYFDVHSLQRSGGAVLPLLAVTLATLAFSLAAGFWFARRGQVDATTAALGMVAGGSAAIVATAKDLGADARVVAFMQYVRLTLVVLSTPLLVRFLLAPHATGFGVLGAPEIEVDGSVSGYAFLALIAVAGGFLGVRLRLPAGALLGPVLLAAAVTAAGYGSQPPELARELAFTVIGLEVGLRFTRETLRTLGRLLPKVLLYSAVTTAVCGLLAWAVTTVSHVTLLNAYLATTPGGINAVLATASASNADVTLVFAVQALRLFLMVLAAPALIRWIISRRTTAPPAATTAATTAPASDPLEDLAPAGH
ncbi:AbrB family transcriptional regulator [Streptomyces sp. H10-C2]|uniref:AbrB family transcriptional regulator n=1 Tax=unclassified Streptomyces TaxID=2593676 RepID=UPI0024B96979|nr:MULTISPECIES: AbrB family transcriptional regulator [unclassified Streptomyces]MDJ0346498.1 AbrB family transcriptional regulator [Streptomyces sp. PH10-H1]MDJ0374968.1 AbrB family transcriptional regulator [Streptomyces sp. H10-C2]